jgi:hypothetical protein
LWEHSQTCSQILLYPWTELEYVLSTKELQKQILLKLIIKRNPNKFLDDCVEVGNKTNQDYVRTVEVVHTCNLSYLEGRDQKDWDLRPVQGKRKLHLN